MSSQTMPIIVFTQIVTPGEHVRLMVETEDATFDPALKRTVADATGVDALVANSNLESDHIVMAGVLSDFAPDDAIRGIGKALARALGWNYYDAVCLTAVPAS